MTLVEKFESQEQFLAYTEYLSGYDFDNAKLIEWYNANPDFRLSYTGIMKAIRPFVIGKLVDAGKKPGDADEPAAE